MKRDFYRELPDGYREDKIIDAKNAKVAVIMNVAAVVVMIATYLITDFIACGRLTIIDVFTDLFGDDFAEQNFGSFMLSLLPVLIYAAATLVYTVLHELTHGVAYKILTGEKLTFGLTASVAYCGVPNIYVGKKTSLIAILSPFVLFSVIFIIAVALSGATPVGLLFKTVFATHVGGCVGDLYGAGLLIFRYKKGCLVKDDGPKQIFFVRDEDKTDL